MPKLTGRKHEAWAMRYWASLVTRGFARLVRVMESWVNRSRLIEAGFEAAVEAVEVERWRGTGRT